MVGHQRNWSRFPLITLFSNHLKWKSSYFDLWIMKIRALGFGKKPAAKIVVVGLDNSGKTTILNHLKTDKTKTESSDIVPTGKNLFRTVSFSETWLFGIIIFEKLFGKGEWLIVKHTWDLNSIFPPEKIPQFGDNHSTNDSNKKYSFSRNRGQFRGHSEVTQVNFDRK